MDTSSFLDEYSCILEACEKPSRYIGEEYLSCAKNFNEAKVRFLLAFPDKYEIGISNFGFKILYHMLNSHKDFLADRLCAPDKDFLELLKGAGKTLYSLELKEPVKKFDFVGFALQYELSYTTILKMLEMSDIPIFSNERGEGDPIVVAGGPCAYNPNALADFIDLFFIGDGEELLCEVCEKYALHKGSGLAREEIIKELSKIEGVYSPKYFASVKKRVSQLKREYAPTKSPIPHFVSVHDRAVVEVRRGCARLCRFCQSAHTNLPVREREKEDVLELVKEYVKNTGYGEYSLLSLSSNDHSEIESIIENLNAYFKNTGVSVSLPSQRADNFSIKLAKLLQDVKKSAVTIAPEAGSQRMRDIINKNLTSEQITNAVLASVKEGWQRVKLYFMIGLPFEETADLDAIVELLGSINSACKSCGLKLPSIVCSVSIFVPKPFTPFQWCEQNSLDEVFEKINYLRDKSRSLRNVKMNFHNPFTSRIEALFSRADRRLGAFVYKLYKDGSYMDSWDENFSHQKYLDTALSLGLDVEKETVKVFDIQEELPWDFIDAGVKKTWLAEMFAASKEVAHVSLGHQ
ncbi:radical SAM [Candidatus Gastranaerophilus sp. (ex Termes propinquus)]|nr:radical SAM [Candidatus Gastranaerophilus sp. (ex Termes propinquus)]